MQHPTLTFVTEENRTELEVAADMRLYFEEQKRKEILEQGKTDEAR